MIAKERSIVNSNYQQIVSTCFMTDVGEFYFVASEKGIIYAGWSSPDELQQVIDDVEAGPEALAHAELAKNELTRYFARSLHQFTVPVDVHGTPFQQDVWAALQQIPYGVTWSYRDLAIEIGRPKAVRAVGQANRANRVAIIIPCHRVIGANGTMVGYSGNKTNLKEYLLDVEQKSGVLLVQ